MTPNLPTLVKKASTGLSSDIPQDLRWSTRALVDAGVFKDVKSVQMALVKTMYGRSIGLDPVTSMSGIYIVGGKPAMSAGLMTALLRRSGKYRYRVKEHTDKVCTLEFLEKVETSPTSWTWEPLGDSTFSMEDAKKAKLASGDNWTKYPRNMLFARAISNGAKWFCADSFLGPVYTPDELAPSIKLVERDGDMVPAPDQEAIEDAQVIDTAGLKEKLSQLPEAELTPVLKLLGVSKLDDLTADDLTNAVELIDAKSQAPA